MAKGGKDKKAKSAEKKARVAQKQEKKATQKEKKSAKKKPGQNDGDEDDVDLDTVLAEYARQQEAFLKITQTVSEPPSARASATLIGSPASDNELFLFGGEHYNGALARFYNDLFIYKTNRDEWLKVTSPNSPLPRSGHAWTRGGNAGGIYLFGGEFSSPKQGTFHHYNDFWHLDPSTREWTKVESKGKNSAPSARSGHRMTYFKNYIILFGGFRDTSHQTEYLHDLWLYDCANYTWLQPTLPPASAKPDARSSFTLLPHESGAVLFGGYSRVKAAGKAVKNASGNQAHSQTILKPKVHRDAWFLRITPPASDAPANGPPMVRWEVRKTPVNSPNPPRAGATMAYHKGRGIQFGGVYDVEADEEGIDSEFFNTLYAWNIERNRCMPLSLRRPRANAKKVVTAAAERMRGGRGRKDEEELLANLARLEATGGLKDLDADDENAKPLILENEGLGDAGTGNDDDAEAVQKVEKAVVWEMPHPRFNAQLTVLDDILYVFGGTFEKGDREYTFDEMWAVDLGKLDGAREIYRRELEDWAGSESEDDSEEEDDEDDEDEDEDVGDNKALSDDGSVAASTQASGGIFSDSASEATADTEVESTTRSALTDGLPAPRPFETLREFFARTGNAWQDVVLAKLTSNVARSSVGEGGVPVGMSIKDLRKRAFDAAEDKWWDCREEIQALEDEQEAAGIGEVVSLADRIAAGATSGGPGRRR